MNTIEIIRRKSNLGTLYVEAEIGCDIHSVCVEAIQLAVRNKMKVEFQFNGVDIIVTENDTPDGTIMPRCTVSKTASAEFASCLKRTKIATGMFAFSPSITATRLVPCVSFCAILAIACWVRRGTTSKFCLRALTTSGSTPLANDLGNPITQTGLADSAQTV